MNPIPKLFQSSINPEEVSLTISSFGKSAVGILTTLAILRGVDPMIVTTNAQTVTEAAQNIVAQYAAIVPAAYAAYQSVQVIWGVVRKISIRVLALFSKASVPAQQ